MVKLFPNHFHHTKTVDNEERHTHSHRTSGHGGVSTLWNPRLNPYAKREDDGNPRILVTTFSIPNAPICVINCYLPSGQSKEATATFMEDLDRLQVIIEKYATEYEVLIIGDMNEDHLRRSGTKEKRTLQLIKDLDLCDPGASLKDVDTYYNPHLGHRSHIDHALVKRTLIGMRWTEVEILPHEHILNSSNSSYHTPISIKAVTSTAIELQKRTKSEVITRYSWDKMDVDKYASVISDELSYYHEKLTMLSPDAAIEVLHHIIATATSDSTPSTSKRNNNRLQNKKWTPDLSAAVKTSKETHFRWKQAGRPSGNHQLWKEKKTAKNKIRSIQRKQAWEERKELRDELSDASENDPKAFYRLIKRQKEAKSNISSLLINGEVVDDPNTIRAEWASYYEQLSQANENDPEAAITLRCMRILSHMHSENIEISEAQLDEAINKLKPGKAADKQGIVAEQLKALPAEAKKEVLNIINSVLRSGKVPDEMKIAYKLPIPKKGKDIRLMDNYRGITITSMFGKILELVCLSLGLEEAINKKVNDLQCGFTRQRSPTMASLLITEAASEARTNRQQLYVASLDARKAFDVVDHHKLKSKCYDLDCTKQIWTALDNIYSEGQEVIRWAGEDSRPYFTQQGVKQGGSASAQLYKIYTTELLDSLRRSRLGTFIGTTYVGSPTCADDMILLANDPFELQAMIDICKGYSVTHKYELHPQKSVVTHMTGSKPTDDIWRMGEDQMPTVEQFTHLGLEWKSGQPTPDIHAHINSARRTAYALMGIGLHGNDGMDPPTSMRTIRLYIEPRLLYGLEATVLTKTQINMLDSYHRSLLRQIQGLPESTATEAIYILIGALPIEALIHMRTLSLLGAVARLPKSHPIHKVATRQLARCDPPRRSWFIYTAEIGDLYGLDVRQQVINPWPKDTWKTHIRTAVTEKWRERLFTNAAKKTTLKRLLHPSELNQAHPVWSSCAGCPYLVEKATVRARLLVDRVTLQSSKAKFSNHAVAPDCVLCGRESEDMKHFLLDCPNLDETRGTKIKDMQSMYKQEGVEPPTSAGEIISAILNASGYRVDQWKDVTTQYISAQSPNEDSHIEPSNHSQEERTKKSREQLQPDVKKSTKNKERGSTNVQRAQSSSSSVRSLKEHVLPANRLMSAFCHQLYIERDIQINQVLLDGGSP